MVLVAMAMAALWAQALVSSLYVVPY